MFENMSTMDMVKLFAPLAAIQLALAVYCAVLVLKKGIRNLNKALWLIIVLFVNLLGPIGFLLFGKYRKAISYLVMKANRDQSNYLNNPQFKSSDKFLFIAAKSFSH